MNPFYSNTPDLRNREHISLFINRERELAVLKEWLTAEKLDESIGAVIGQPRIGKSHLCYKGLSELEDQQGIPCLLLKANRIEDLSQLLVKLYRLVTEEIKKIPASSYEKNEAMTAFYDCLREDMSHFDELLAAAVDSITRQVSVKKGEILRNKVNANIEGKVETGINLFMKAALSLKTFIGKEREKSRENAETDTRTVVYHKPGKEGLMTIINDFFHGYFLLSGEQRLLLYIDDLDRISPDVDENNRLISELIYYLKDLSSRNSNLVIFASISEAFYNMNKEKFFRRIYLLRPLTQKDLKNLYRKRCELFGLRFLSLRTVEQLASVFQGFPGRFLDALDKLYMEGRKSQIKGIGDIYHYCLDEIGELEDGTRDSISGLRRILEENVAAGQTVLEQRVFGGEMELHKTPLVGEILWEIPHKAGTYRINPLYVEALRQKPEAPGNKK